MVVTAESGLRAAAAAMAVEQEVSVGVQDPALRAAVDATPAEAVGRRRRKRPEARTEFRGVTRTGKGTYRAQITDPKAKAQMWLGTFCTAEEAAGAYDAAAFKLYGSAAKPNFKPAAADDGVAPHLSCTTAEPSSPVKKKKKKRKSDRQFRGVFQTLGGRYRAEIKHRKILRQLGTFDTAEDAARAYDAAAVELHGAKAVTNFKAGGGVSEPSGETVGGVKMKVEEPTAARPDARTELQGVHGQLGGECSAQTWDSKDFDLLDDLTELPALDFSASLIPGPLLAGLRTDLPQAKRQLVDEFIKDVDFTDVVN